MTVDPSSEMSGSEDSVGPFGMDTNNHQAVHARRVAISCGFLHKAALNLLKRSFWMRYLSLVLATICFLSIATAGCSTAVMSVDSELSSMTEPLTVSGANPRLWNRPLSFGPWRTVEVREGLRWGFGAPLLGLEAGFARQPYRLVLENSDVGTVQVECVASSITLSRSGWTLDPTFGSLPVLACGFRSDTGDEWTMKMYERGTKRQGEITSSRGARLQIRSVHTLQGSRFRNADPVGYEIASDESTVGAVEIVNRGRVWISPAAEQRRDAQIAAAAAALLLFDPTSE